MDIWRDVWLETGPLIALRIYRPTALQKVCHDPTSWQAVLSHLPLPTQAEIHNMRCRPQEPDIPICELEKNHLYTVQSGRAILDTHR